jgi:hypothetical protein
MTTLRFTLMGQTNDRLNFRTWYNISKADRCDMAWKKCVYIKDDHHLTSQFYYIYNWIRLTSKFKEWVVKTLICRLMISYELSKMIQEKRHVYLKSEWNFGIAFIFMIWFSIMNWWRFPLLGFLGPPNQSTDIQGMIKVP